MKHNFRGILAFISALGIPTSAFAQVVVMAEPPPPQQDQYTAPTTPGQVWVQGYYDINPSGQYQWTPGHWDVPPQQGMVWVAPRVGRRRGQMMFFQGRWDWPDRVNRRYFQQGAFGLPTQIASYQIGTLVTGVLGQNDYHDPQGGFAEDYAVYLQANQQVSFLVRGGPTPSGQRLDVVASIHLNGRELARDDDGAGYPDAMLNFRAPATGVYALRVSTFGSQQETGTFTIQSWSSGGPQNPYELPPTFGLPGNPQPMPPQPMPPQPMPPQPGPITAQPIAVGQTIQGQLVQGDNITPEGAFSDNFVINLVQNQGIQLTVNTGPDNYGQQFDTVLDVFAPNGQPIAHDDDSGGNQNPRLAFVSQMPGQYRIRLRAFSQGRMGGYNLMVQPGNGGIVPPGPGPIPVPNPTPNPNGQVIQVGQTIQGSLTQGDLTNPSGAFADNYAVALQQGQAVVFTAQGGPASNGGTIDTVLDVLNINGQVLGHDDDSGGNRNPRLAFTAPVPGTYIVRIRSYSQGVAGSYLLTAGQGLAPAVPVNPGPQPQPFPQPQPQPQPLPGTMPLQLGQTVQGTLQQGDSVTQEGGFADNYTLMLAPGQTITLVVRANDGQGRTFDTALQVISPVGDVVAQDDDSGGDFNPRLSFTPRIPGPYTVRVRAYWRGRTGAYTLSAFAGNLLQQ